MKTILATVSLLSLLLAIPSCVAPPSGSGDPDQIAAEAGDESLDRERDVDEEAEVDSGVVVEPFHVAVFDHAPTEEEMDLELQAFVEVTNALQGNIGNAALTPIGPSTPGAGQKRVRLGAITSDIANAGTDEADQTRFVGVWEVPGGDRYSVTFSLNNPDQDDLDRGTTSIFYYLLTLGQYEPGATQDKFIKGMITNSSTDGWRCQEMTVTDRNHDGYQRAQSLPFDQWVDTPSAPESSWMVGNMTSWLSYN